MVVVLLRYDPGERVGNVLVNHDSSVSNFAVRYGVSNLEKGGTNERRWLAEDRCEDVPPTTTDNVAMAAWGETGFPVLLQDTVRINHDI